MPISPDDFSRFVKDTSKHSCHHCEDGNFAPLGSGSEDHELGEFELTPLGSDVGFRLYGAVCLSCGSVYNFLAATVDEWVKTHPEKKVGK